LFYRRHTCRKGLSKQTSLVIGRRRFAYLLQMVLISDKSQTDLGNLQTVTQAENKGYSSLRSRKKHSAGSKSKLNHGKSHIRLTVILLIISCSYGGLSRAKWLPVHTSSLFSLLMIHRLKTCKQPVRLPFSHKTAASRQRRFTSIAHRPLLGQRTLVMGVARCPSRSHFSLHAAAAAAAVYGCRC